MKKALILLIAVTSAVVVSAQNKLVDGNNDFAFKIYRETKTDLTNFFISPFSIHVAISIANEGTRGDTRKEIDRLLSLNRAGERASLYRDLIHRTINLNDAGCLAPSPERKSKNSLTIANSLWINDEFKLDESFKNSIVANYGSDLFSFNDRNIEAANGKLSGWIAAKTNNKIKDMPGLDKSTMVSIVNAIHFIGVWETPFDAKETRKEKFTTTKGSKADVKFMHQRSHYVYYENEDIQSIQLPYRCDQFSMVVILPKKKMGLSEVEKKMNASYFTLISSGQSEEVILSLPKFKIETTIEPKDAIVNMGGSGMFSDTADFTGMSKTSHLKISRITHKAFIETDEEKTEAAAVTKIDMVMSGSAMRHEMPLPPKIFNADHPFMFVIVDKRTGAVLFTGRYAEPD